MAKLLIIESPGKVKKLEAILGNGWKVAASVGHIRDLPEHEMGVEPPTFVPTYVLSERGAEVVEKLQREVARSEAVYLATDPDREGESISWHLQQVLGLGHGARRVSFNAITESAVLEAIQKPRPVDNRLVGAQEARRVLDRLVGYTFSPVLSEVLGEPLSAGRVQTPAVRLVVDREREIAHFAPTDHYGVRLRFADAKRGGEWFAFWQTDEFVTDDNPYFLDEGFAQRVAAVRDLDVTDYKASERSRAPPAPFTTSTMQQAASVRLGFDPARTMQLAQSLYEDGHITYHRTDNPNISADDWPEIQREAARLGLNAVDKPRTFKASESAQAGHPAVTPTHWSAEAAGEGEDAQALYRLIRVRALASQLADARYAVRQADLSALIDARPVRFKARSERLTEPGWMALLASDDTQEADADGSGDLQQDGALPELAAGQGVQAADGGLLRQRTRAPKRYTKASLVAKLESEGIGRPSTYAAIMENIERRGYITEKGRFLQPAATAMRLVDAVSATCAFAQLQFTSAVESDLDKIAGGTVSYTAVVKSLHERLAGEVDSLKARTAPRFPCPKCGNPLRRIKGEFSTFWGCSAHPACDAKLDDKNGQPVERKAPEPSKYSCPECGKPLIRRTKTGKAGYDFWGCTGFKEGCRASFENQRGKPVFKGSKDAAT